MSHENKTYPTHPRGFCFGTRQKLQGQSNLSWYPGGSAEKTNAGNEAKSVATTSFIILLVFLSFSFLLPLSSVEDCIVININICSIKSKLSMMNGKLRSLFGRGYKQICECEDRL